MWVLVTALQVVMGSAVFLWAIFVRQQPQQTNLIGSDSHALLCCMEGAAGRLLPYIHA